MDEDKRIQTSEMNKKTYIDFDIYSRALVASRDVDPTYPVVASIIEHEGFEKLWFSFVYVAFYSLESAIIMCRLMPDCNRWDPALFRKLRTSSLKKFGHERRGTARNIDTQINNFNCIKDFLLQYAEKQLDFYEGNRTYNFDGFLEQYWDSRKILQQLPFHGGWASFKLTEIFEKALGYDKLKITDLGLDGRDPNSNDGPIGGLRWLYGREHEYSEEMFFPTWNNFGSNLAKAWGVDIGEIETCLCKWHKMSSGKYHIGHDVEEFIELKHILGNDVFKSIMSEHFDERLWKGKTGVQKQNKNVYKNTGKIINSEFASQLPKVDVLEMILQS